MENWLRLGARLDEAGSAGSGSGGSGTPTPTPTTPPAATQPPATPPAPTTQPPATTTPPATTQQAPEGFVPAESLRAVTTERDRLAREAREREEADQTKRGEFEALATKRAEERDEWKTRFVSTARRSAFVAKVAKDVADPEAAYKLALADGFLNDVKVDDDGNADAKAIAEAVKATTDAYKFLKAGAGSFGGERGGSQPDAQPDDAAITPRERARRYHESQLTRR